MVAGSDHISGLVYIHPYPPPAVSIVWPVVPPAIDVARLGRSGYGPTSCVQWASYREPGFSVDCIRRECYRYTLFVTVSATKRGGARGFFVNMQKEPLDSGEDALNVKPRARLLPCVSQEGADAFPDLEPIPPETWWGPSFLTV